MIKTRSDLVYYIKADAKRNSIYGFWSFFASFIRGGEHAHVLRYLINLRILEYHSNNKGIFNYIMFLFWKWRHGLLSLKYNIHIYENTCGYGLCIQHLGGVILNVRSIGNHCSINTGVVFGEKCGRDNTPFVGNRVQVGPGAKIIGRVTIGDDAFIAANAVVVHDVAAKSVVGGVPAKEITRG